VTTEQVSFTMALAMFLICAAFWAIADRDRVAFVFPVVSTALACCFWALKVLGLL